MTLILKSDGVYTDSTLPKFQVDPIIPNNGLGALLLYDFSSKSSDNSFVTGASGLKVENLVWDLAINMIPTGVQDTLRGVTLKNFNVGEGVVELTPKNGVNVTVSKTVAVAGHGFAIKTSDLIKQYLLTNSTHNYFFSRWGRTTRVSSDTIGQYATEMHAQSNVNTGKLYFTTPVSQNGGTFLGTRKNGDDNTLGNYIRNAATTWTGTLPSLAAFISLIQMGSLDAFSAQDVNKSSSGIFYKYYIEDMTVSGRTYAQIDAIDNALYTAAVNTAGGRFYGDTFRDPTTIA